MRKTVLGTALALATTAALVAPVSAAGGGTPPPPPPTGTLTVVHGIPGPGGFPVTVDIRNLTTGATVATDVPAVFGDNPVLQLPAARYQVDVKVGGKVALSGRTLLRAGDIDSVVAHLTEKGAPTASVFGTIAKPPAGQARVVVRHLAAAPAVDVWATPPDCAFPKGINDIKLISSLTNPKQATVDVPAGSYCVRVKAAGTFTTVLTADFALAKDKIHVVYAVGNLADGTFRPIVQVF